MNISPWLIYIWGIADRLASVLGAMIPATLVLGVVAFAIRCACESESGVSKATVLSLRRICATMFVLLPISVIGYALMPSSKTIAIMVVVPAIIESDVIQKDLPEIYNLGVEALKEQLKEAAKK